ncbi:hypothetical protein HDE78_004104 [Rhodanobacter sp. K2T2]|nr:hypothetical protein [Rhodanobacter sp. K2T2]
MGGQLAYQLFNFRDMVSVRIQRCAFTGYNGDGSVDRFVDWKFVIAKLCRQLLAGVLEPLVYRIEIVGIHQTTSSLWEAHKTYQKTGKTTSAHKVLLAIVDKGAIGLTTMMASTPYAKV